MNERIVVKVGSNVLGGADGGLDITRMSTIVDQVATLKKEGYQVILVSSGAVASGRREISPSHHLDRVSSRQLYSSVGQVRLINRYYDLFREKGILVGQVLTMKECFSTRNHYLNQRACIEVMLENEVLPIVNENDTVSVTELMFTDNDELSGLIATMMGAGSLIILSNVDGVYDGNPSEEGTSLISVIRPQDDISQFIKPTRSEFGRGGMLTKTSIARRLAGEGISVVIANGLRDGILCDIVLGPHALPCTRFEPTPSSASSIKKWIAHSGGFSKGKAVLDDAAVATILGPKVASVLPVGVVSVEGDFDEGDIISLYSKDGERIGLGKAEYDCSTASSLIGKRGERPLVHYDYLYIES